MKQTLAVIVISLFSLILSLHSSANETRAFSELCESFNNCPQKDEPKIQTQIIIQKEVVHVEMPVQRLTPEPTVRSPQTTITNVQPPINTQPAKPYIFNNKVVRIELLGLRKTEDNRRLIAQVNLTNQLKETLWLSAYHSKHFMISDTNAKIWKLKKITGISQNYSPDTRFTPQSSSKCQLIFELSEKEELTDNSPLVPSPPYFMSGKLRFSTEKLRQEFAFGFDDISIH